MHKDLKLASETAKEINIELDFLDSAENIFHKANQQGLSEADFTAIYKYLKGKKIK
jgi:3-hydroxyisobutyrate dehydrogenase-like beta-hydroxyacid dehydrogenase